jgi:hypothetical protein
MKKLHDVRWCVRRYMMAMHKIRTDQRVYPGYISFEEGHRPPWWTDDLALAAWGTVLGVHEDVTGSPDGAFVVTDRGLAIFHDGSVPVWVPYADIIGEGTDRLSKEPVSMSLHIEIRSGERVEIPFHHRNPGTAFAFVQFLGCALRWCDSAMPPDVRIDNSPHTCPHCRTPGTQFRVADGALICPACGRSFKV